MMRKRTFAAGSLALLLLFGCTAADRVVEARPETEKIQIVGQLETAVPTKEPKNAEIMFDSTTPEPSLTQEPTEAPTPVHTKAPTAEPTEAPTEAPTAEPTEEPIPEPIAVPTAETTEPVVPETEISVKAEPEPTDAEKLCALAESFLDTQYCRSGTSPEKGFDPGGFVYYCLNQLGVKIKHKSSKGYSEYDRWTKIESIEDLEPGDLCFFITPGNESVNCVTIYLGDGQMIYPSSGEGRVIKNKISSNYWKEAFVFARRVF